MEASRVIRLQTPIRFVIGVSMRISSVQDWHGARLDFLARFILALLQVHSVNLARLAHMLSNRPNTSSNYGHLEKPRSPDAW